jgi:hypothetical protein
MIMKLIKKAIIITSLLLVLTTSLPPEIECQLNPVGEQIELLL